MKRKTFRTITISRSATKEQIVAACLRAFHIHDDPKNYILTDVYGTYVMSLTERETKAAKLISFDDAL